MTQYMPNHFQSRRGYYTLEAAMLLPLILLMILALAYYTKAEGSWEEAFHCAIDESSRSAAMACDGVHGIAVPLRIRARIDQDVTGISEFRVRRFLYGYSDTRADELSSYLLEVRSDLRLPAGFHRPLTFQSQVKYRGFVGRNYGGAPLGTEGLESGLPEDPVWIFPQSGERYHRKTCSYVKATVHSQILTASLRAAYESCSSCRSQNLPLGSLVYCFEGQGTAYHRGSCRTIDRRTVVMDRTEAIAQGYTPCSKCGGSIP